MRNSFYPALVCVLFILLLSACCRNCPPVNPVCNLDQNGIDPNIHMVPNKLVLRFNIPDSVIKREEIDEYLSDYDSLIDVQLDSLLGVSAQKKEFCPCDPSQQIWTFPEDEDILDIETALSGTKDKKGKKNVEGDQEFIINLPKEGDGINTRPDISTKFLAELKTVKPNDKINIAVLDTGIDLSYFRDNPINLFENPSFLRLGDNCDQSGKSGWNFVKNNPNVSDDYENIGHGTLVTNVIVEELKNNGVPYTILPIKVFDSNGNGNYSTILCGLSFLNQIQKRQKNIQLVNMSFGGALGNISEDKIKVFNDYMSEMKNDALFVASSGNCGFNNDLGENFHYPSSYTSNNLVAVAGYKKCDNKYCLSPSSNYGIKSIDVAASFERTSSLKDYQGNNLKVKLKGTSYGTAFVSSRLAYIFNKQSPISGQSPLTPMGVKKEFLADVDNNPHTKKSTDLETFIKNGRYVKE